MAGVTVNEGTQTNIAADLVGTQQYQIIKLDRGAAGVSSLFTGTLDAVTNVAGGTITSLVKGTISTGTFSMTTGTLSVGTIDAVSQLPPNNFATVISSGTSTLGTIKAAVSGSQIFITDLVISCGSATNVEIGSGGTSTNIMGTLYFNANSGAILNFRQPLSTVAGSALVFKQSANGPLSITALGFVR